MRKPVVALPGTLDTKAVEYAFVKEQIERSGCEALVIDISVLGGDYFEPDIHKEEVAAAAGTDLAAFAARVEGDTRVRANRAMSEGLAVILKKLTAEGKIDAVLGMGGTGGTDSLSAAFRQLPLEMPKMLVSTMASNNTKPYVGNSDMIMMY
ncbi:MAG: Tm-1-like ATP-binding domain-containing protein, partial [Lachnospiraceae bacterium]|nr:Tm-1-like ATP-binding domain-containing protein [Lachnospiraceae bacterium]